MAAESHVIEIDIHEHEYMYMYPWIYIYTYTYIVLASLHHCVDPGRALRQLHLQVQYSLVSRGPEQQAIKATCDDLGIKLISYSPLGLGLLTGKYDSSSNVLPNGPRALLFKQILPGLQPLIQQMRDIATARKKTVPQVSF